MEIFVPIDPKSLIELTDAALAADYTRVRRAANAVARALASDGNDEAAKEIRAVVQKRGVPLRASGYMETLPVDAKSRLPLVEEQTWPANPIFLNDSATRTFQDFLSDVRHIDELSAKGLASRLGLLLSGPPERERRSPGTSPRSLAALLCGQAGLGDFVAARRHGKEHPDGFRFRPVQRRRSFLDEMDAIAKLRRPARARRTQTRRQHSYSGPRCARSARGYRRGDKPSASARPRHMAALPYKIELGAPEIEVERIFGNTSSWKTRRRSFADILAVISQGLSGADIETIALTHGDMRS